ncbi:MAG TPA: transglycosylase SLT domain-containing protein, partial [Chloroflexota bacterium]
PGAAATRFRTAVQLDPKGRPAQAALDELVALQDPFALSFDAGETRFEQNRYREALAAYTAVLQQSPSDARAARAYYGWGVSLVRLGQDRAGVVVLESIADHFPNTADAADGVFRGGRIRESLADLNGAAQAYRRVMAQPGAGTRATDAQFRLAFVDFRQGNLASAVEGWRDLAGRVSAPDDRAQALFWLGKGLRASGDQDGARAAWTSARDSDPHGFYGLRAADLLDGRAEPRAQADQGLAVVQSRTDDPLGSISAWVASRGGLSAAQQRLEADAGLANATALLSMGLRQAAVWELGAVEARLGNDVGALALLGGWEQQRGLYNTALVLGFDLASVANVSLASGPAAVRRLVYPLPHPMVLSQAGQQLRVDPLLFSALMRQESNMDQAIESAAQARGLSQLIASTGYDAARALGQYGFVSSDLFKPKISITLGAFTFGQRLARYDQRIFPALAAYNAAQFAVDGWLLAAGEADLDTFAEAIPFTETYPYVQRIYENYRQYLELYGSPSTP